MDLQPILERYLPPLEQALRDALPIPRPELGPHYSMMHYHLGWVDETFAPVTGSGGKRLRPLLCLLVTEAVGSPMERAMPAAVALELLHNFSLVHDDIEDHSATRRGRPTVWKVWGVPQATNVGDGLFALTRVALGRLADLDVPPARVLQVILTFDAACVALTEGQFMDMSFESRANVTLTEYLQMIQDKTATLIRIACRLGALIAGAPPEIVAHYTRFGESLGLAFQIQDDWLGVWGEESVTGKPVGDDIRERKKNYPVVWALEQLAAVDDGRLVALHQREHMDQSTVQQILDILDAVGAKAHTQEAAQEYHDQALAALAATGIQNQAQTWLSDLARVLASRKA
jgi:geranylgeranyl diphosphate synthase type I